MVTRDAPVVDHKVIFQPAPDVDDRLDQGIEFDAVDDHESIGGNRTDLFIHTVILMEFCQPLAGCNHLVLFLDVSVRYLYALHYRGQHGTS